MRFHIWRTVRSKRPSNRSRSFHPRLETLEDRTVLSTLTVTNTLDKGAGSLRDAITGAKDGDTIVFDPSLNNQTITLTSDQLTVNNSIDIAGPGASLLSISGADANRVFEVSGGKTVTITGLTITHGLGKGNVKGQNSGGGGGGAILNDGSTVNLANDVFAYNQSSDHGGAISNGPNSVLTVTNSSFIANIAVGKVGSAYVEGGAIWNTDNPSGATAVVIGCTFSSNQAIGANGGSTSGALSESNGGAIHSEGTDYLTVQNCTFIGNQAIAGNGGNGKGSAVLSVDVATGGAIANDDGLHLTVDSSTFSSNQAIGGSNATSDSGPLGQGIGGAIVSEGVATITNSNFDHNLAQGGSTNTGGSAVLGNGRGFGGAIANVVGTVLDSLTVTNCSFTDNLAVGGVGNLGGLTVATGVGGGIANQGGTATVTGSTFTGNQAIGGTGAAGGNGAAGLGGGIANIFGGNLTAGMCTFTGNLALGGAGGSGGNGGNGFGGGLFNDGFSIFPTNAGTPATLTVTTSTVTANSATGGAAGSGGNAGQGIGGGVYFAAGGTVCLDASTVANILSNAASTSNNDIFGVYTTC
jgi:hypothetical protein